MLECLGHWTRECLPNLHRRGKTHLNNQRRMTLVPWPCCVKARFSNQHKRLRHDILEYLSHLWSVSVTLEQYFGVKSDAKMTPNFSLSVVPPNAS